MVLIVLVREGEPASFYSILISPLQVRFFTVDAPIYILTNNVWFPFLYIVTNTCYVFFIITILTDGSGILLWF